MPSGIHRLILLFTAIIIFAVVPGFAVAGMAGNRGGPPPERFPVHVKDRHRPALEARVVQLADELGALPVALDDRSKTCPTADIAITYERIPQGAFQYGAYIEPLTPPHPTKGNDALGIAFCRSSDTALMGFEALWSDDVGWQVWPVPYTEDDPHSEHEGAH